MMIIHLDLLRLYVGALKGILEKLPNAVYRPFESHEDATRFVREQLQEGSLIRLIITDYSPARINGYKYAADVKRLAMQSTSRSIPIIVLTMVSETHPIVQEGLTNGAFDLYLSKSADSSRILRAVEHLLCRSAD